MPSKINSKLLFITVLCATLAVLFVIAPATAEMYSLILLGLAQFRAIFAVGNARKVRRLQYMVSTFILLSALVFAAIFAAVTHIAVGGMQYIMVAICAVIVVFCIKLLFTEIDK